MKYVKIFLCEVMLGTSLVLKSMENYPPEPLQKSEPNPVSQKLIAQFASQLHNACSCKNIEMIKKICTKSHKRNIANQVINSRKKVDDLTPIIKAAHAGNTDVVTCLLELGANPNKCVTKIQKNTNLKIYQSLNPLHAVCFDPYLQEETVLDIVEILLEKKADPTHVWVESDSPDFLSSGWARPVNYAKKNNFKKVIETLQKASRNKLENEYQEFNNSGIRINGLIKSIKTLSQIIQLATQYKESFSKFLPDNNQYSVSISKLTLVELVECIIKNGGCIQKWPQNKTVSVIELQTKLIDFHHNNKICIEGPISEAFQDVHGYFQDTFDSSDLEPR